MEEPNDFQFYLRFARPLVLNLPILNERIKAAAWIKRLAEKEDDPPELKLDCLKLLLFALQKQSLGGPFIETPDKFEKLEDIPNLKDFTAIAKSIIANEANTRSKKLKSTYLTDYSGDMKEFVAVQEIPNFGVHAYYAFSSVDPIPNWDRSDRIKISRVLRADEIPSTPAPPPPAEGEEPPPNPPAEPVPDILRKFCKPTAPPVTPMGIVKPSTTDIPPPTWGSNLLEVRDYSPHKELRVPELPELNLEEPSDDEPPTEGDGENIQFSTVPVQSTPNSPGKPKKKIIKRKKTEFDPKTGKAKQTEETEEIVAISSDEEEPAQEEIPDITKSFDHPFKDKLITRNYRLALRTLASLNIRKGRLARNLFPEDKSFGESDEEDQMSKSLRDMEQCIRETMTEEEDLAAPAARPASPPPVPPQKLPPNVVGRAIPKRSKRIPKPTHKPAKPQELVGIDMSKDGERIAEDAVIQLSRMETLRAIKRILPKEERGDPAIFSYDPLVRKAAEGLEHKPGQFGIGSHEKFVDSESFFKNKEFPDEGSFDSDGNSPWGSGAGVDKPEDFPSSPGTNDEFAEDNFTDAGDFLRNEEASPVCAATKKPAEEKFESACKFFANKNELSPNKNRKDRFERQSLASPPDYEVFDPSSYLEGVVETTHVDRLKRFKEIEQYRRKQYLENAALSSDAPITTPKSPPKPQRPLLPTTHQILSDEMIPLPGQKLKGSTKMKDIQPKRKRSSPTRSPKSKRDKFEEKTPPQSDSRRQQGKKRTGTTRSSKKRSDRKETIEYQQFPSSRSFDKESPDDLLGMIPGSSYKRMVHAQNLEDKSSESAPIQEKYRKRSHRDDNTKRRSKQKDTVTLDRVEKSPRQSAFMETIGSDMEEDLRHIPKQQLITSLGIPPLSKNVHNHSGRDDSTKKRSKLTPDRVEDVLNQAVLMESIGNDKEENFRHHRPQPQSDSATRRESNGRRSGNRDENTKKRSKQKDKVTPDRVDVLNQGVLMESIGSDMEERQKLIQPRSGSKKTPPERQPFPPQYKYVQTALVPERPAASRRSPAKSPRPSPPTASSKSPPSHGGHASGSPRPSTPRPSPPTASSKSPPSHAGHTSRSPRPSTPRPSSPDASSSRLYASYLIDTPGLSYEFEDPSSSRYLDSTNQSSKSRSMGTPGPDSSRSARKTMSTGKKRRFLRSKLKPLPPDVEEEEYVEEIEEISPDSMQRRLNTIDSEATPQKLTKHRTVKSVTKPGEKPQLMSVVESSVYEPVYDPKNVLQIMQMKRVDRQRQQDLLDMTQEWSVISPVKTQPDYDEMLRTYTPVKKPQKQREIQVVSGMLDPQMSRDDTYIHLTDSLMDKIVKQVKDELGAANSPIDKSTGLNQRMDSWRGTPKFVPPPPTDVYGYMNRISRDRRRTRPEPESYRNSEEPISISNYDDDEEMEYSIEEVETSSNSEGEEATDKNEEGDSKSDDDNAVVMEHRRMERTPEGVIVVELQKQTPQEYRLKKVRKGKNYEEALDEMSKIK